MEPSGFDHALVDSVRELFPITKTGTAYFAHCTAAPLAEPVVTAVQQVLERYARLGAIDSEDRIAVRERWRANTAALLGAHADEIAFACNTVAALQFVANGLDWKPGDVVVTADIEFPANVYPWLNLRDRGVEVRFVRAR